MTAQGPFREPESTTTKWVAIFVLLSLLVHAIILAIILLITVFMPVPKVEPIEPETNDVTLSVVPPPAVPKPQPKTIFVPTQPEANAPHKQQPIVSANDHDLTSNAQVAKAPDSLMPEVDGRLHNADLNTSPLIKAPETPQPSTTPPTPKQTKPDKPTPPQPKPQQAPQKPPQPPQPNPKPAPPNPPKPRPTVDPDTGLPVLPPLAVATMAPPDASAQPLAPAPSLQQQAGNVPGALGRRGDNSPAAMATVLGKYKQKVYLAVGSRWYPKANNALQILGVGVVHIQFTIYQDGTVTTKVLDAGDSTMQTLLSLSLNSIRESAPFDKFDDYPGLRDELIKEQGGDGTSYTDDYTFTIYGH
jgi:outer membrane biosynthesis protein TonB